MAEWFNKQLIFPSIVALIASFSAGFFAAYFSGQLTKSKELSNTADGPISYLSDPSLKSISVAVNGEAVSDLVSFRVRIWNSGTEPIDQLPVTIRLSDQEKSFSILSVTHQTKPTLEFGKIETLSVEPDKRRFKYDLLNPNDADVITILANASAKINVFAKGRGLIVEEQRGEARTAYWQDRFSLFSLVAGVAGGFVVAIFASAFRAIREVKEEPYAK